ncbi:hypothetical protein NQ317_012715 [Molorchus minor]|uniref:Carboxylic ester hydrolase n=1 Tax=Molorchus minor TaxID=1323400 RepID=A0ABQ9J543_9CUCU|nr:hypothetical protein NQ317_012715 [Molorchus minor]
MKGKIIYGRSEVGTWKAMNPIDLTIVVSTIIVLCSAVSEDPIVQTKYGLIRGSVELSISGREYYAFRGIPYATPPVGNLRFKAPEPPVKWTHVLPVQEDSQHCLQKNYLFSNPRVIGSEDCLYLNVYTPKLRARRHTPKSRLQPVMVFIHWGGFFTGFASSDYLGPEYLMEKNVVLVTFNYRLGILEDITNDDTAPGNFGLKDQVAALKWVQDNIENFGGNNDKVTIFGQSAGGASVNFHMFSPESRSLFQQGISQSGTSLAIWAKPFSGTQMHLVKAQAKFVGCPETDNTTLIVDCLRNVGAEDLVNSGDKFKFFSVDPYTVYYPSVEKRTKNNPKPFITKQPVEYIRNREFYKVPWIIGVVDDEGLIRAEALLRQTQTRQTLNHNFHTIMPHLMGITRQHFKKCPKMLYTDRAFAYSSYQAGLFHNFQGHNDIWFYNFNYSGQYSYGDIFAATKEDIDYEWGVSHCDDLLYLFKSPAIFQELKKTNDKIMKDTMIELWTNFAIYG